MNKTNHSVSVLGHEFSEVLGQGLRRAAVRMPRPHPATDPRPAPQEAAPQERPAFTLTEHEAVLARFTSRLPTVLPPEEWEAPEVRRAFESFAHTVLRRVGDAEALSRPAAAPALSPRHLAAASSLLLECGSLYVLRQSLPRDRASLVRAISLSQNLGEAIRSLGSAFWEGDDGWGESRRLARRLHDEVDGALAAAEHGITRAATTDPALREARLADARRRLTEAREANRAVVDTINHRTHVPPLRTALENFLASEDATARATIRFGGDASLVPARMRRELFLTMREALRNSLDAPGSAPGFPHLEIVVRTTRRWVYAKVEDSGNGHTGVAGARLRSMAERMEDLGGRLRISPSETGGSRVEIHLPLDPRGSSLV